MSLVRAATIIENNWNTVKSEIRHTWRKLTDADLESIENYKDLLTKIQSVYEISEEDAVDRIESFINKLALDPNLTMIQELTEKLHKNASDVKSRLRSQLKSTWDNKEEISNDIMQYAKKNPLKVAGSVLLTFLAVKKLLR